MDWILFSLIENFDRLFYIAVVCCKISYKFFDKMINKREFLKIIKLYIKHLNIWVLSEPLFEFYFHQFFRWYYVCKYQQSNFRGKGICVLVDLKSWQEWNCKIVVTGQFRFFPESWYGMKYEWYETGQDVLSTVGIGGTLIHNACFLHLILIKHNNFHLFSSEGILKQYCYEYFNTILLNN